MAIVMVVEDGTNVAGANSYVDLTFANNYLQYNIHTASVWSALTDDVKKACLIRGTQVVDNYFNYEGLKTYDDSALRWPRYGADDLDGIVIPDNVIPIQLKQAVCELAMETSQGDITEDPGSAGLSELTVDVISLKFDKLDRPTNVSSLVKQLMRTLGDYVGPGSFVRFAKVIRS